MSDDGTLHLPTEIWVTYEQALAKHGALELCRAGITVRGKVGGQSHSETIDHFAYRFANSASRICYIVTNPKLESTSITEDIRVSFSHGNVYLLDLIGGTGAATAAMLSSICKLRKDGSLPYLPLNVTIIAADFSATALGIYRDIITGMSQELAENGIVTDLKTVPWDAADVPQTVQLCDDFLALAAHHEIFVLVANLSGIKKSGLDPLAPSFLHISQRISNRYSTLMWVEPGNKGGSDFIHKVTDLILSISHWFTNRTPNELKLAYKWYHQLQISNNVINSELTVKFYRGIKG